MSGLGPHTNPEEKRSQLEKYPKADEEQASHANGYSDRAELITGDDDGQHRCYQTAEEGEDTESECCEGDCIHIGCQLYFCYRQSLSLNVVAPDS